MNRTVTDGITYRLSTLPALRVSCYSLLVVLLAFLAARSVACAEEQQQAKASTADQLAANWYRFRGPGGLGISSHKNVPTRFNGETGEGILWKTEVPLPGKNSPIVWGNRIFLTGADPDQGQEVYCFDADNGELLWQREVPKAAFNDEELEDLPDGTGFAAPTAVTDGRRVYAIFATGDVVAFDFQGNRCWLRPLGVPKNIYGHASSLTIEQGLLIIQFDQGTNKDNLSKLFALKTETGETAWASPRAIANSWPTPIVIEQGGKRQIITAADPWVIAYAPKDGHEIWRAKCLQGDVGPSPVFADGIVYVVNEFPALSAIRADGQGDVTATHILWRCEDSLPDCASPLATNEFVLMAASYGLITCCDAKRGNILWEEEFDALFTASPSLAGGQLYLFDEDGAIWIVRPTLKGCERIAETTLGEKCFASPAFADGRIYIRGEEHLFCAGKP